jgi:hypothetical protein
LEHQVGSRATARRPQVKALVLNGLGRGFDLEDVGIAAPTGREVSGTDIEGARRVASRILAGRVAINGMLDDPDAPWGGFKYSGIGREVGRYGIEAFLETRAILE